MESGNLVYFDVFRLWRMEIVKSKVWKYIYLFHKKIGDRYRVFRVKLSTTIADGIVISKSCFERCDTLKKKKKKKNFAEKAK